MKGFKKVIREIKLTVAEMLILPSLLGAVVVFLAFYLVLAILDYPPLYSLVPAILYVLVIFWKELSMNKIKLVEKYYPHLHEKLRTAADYATVDDTMVNELHEEVLRDIKSVSSSSFISRKKLFTMAITCVVLCFMIISITHFNINAADFKVKAKNAITDFTRKVLIEQSENENILRMDETTVASGSGVGAGINEDIFGDQSLASLGDDELEVEIKPSTLELKIGKVSKAEKKDFEEVFPSEITLAPSVTYEENIPKERQEIVKEYFKGISAG